MKQDDEKTESSKNDFIVPDETRDDVPKQTTAAERVANTLAATSILDKSDSWEEIDSSEIDGHSHDSSSNDQDDLHEEEEEGLLEESETVKTRILDVDELLELFMNECPEPLRQGGILTTPV